MNFHPSKHGKHGKAIKYLRSYKKQFSTKNNSDRIIESIEDDINKCKNKILKNIQNLQFIYKKRYKRKYKNKNKKTYSKNKRVKYDNWSISETEYSSSISYKNNDQSNSDSSSELIDSSESDKSTESDKSIRSSKDSDFDKTIKTSKYDFHIDITGTTKQEKYLDLINALEKSPSYCKSYVELDDLSSSFDI